MLTGMIPFIAFKAAPRSNMRKLALCVALPALAIIVAALAQLLLTTIWPGVQRFPFPVVSADSYFGILLIVALCFLAAAWLQRNVRIPAGAGAVCTAVAPTVWLGLMLWAIMRHVEHIAWLRPITLFMIAAAIAPLAGVTAGWSAASMMRRIAPALA